MASNVITLNIVLKPESNVCLPLPSKILNAREAVIKILSEEWPLKTRQILTKMSRFYGLEVSYQAVYKTLKQLLDQRIVDKSADGFNLNTDWVKKTIAELKRIEERYAMANA